MADVVLAVAKCPLAVLPGLAPMNRRQTHQEGNRPQRTREALHSFSSENAAPLQAVIPADVVVDTGIQSRHLASNCIPFGRMQVAARWVRTQRPAIALILLPGRQSQGQLEHHRHAVELQRCGRDRTRRIEVGIGCRASIIGQKRQFDPFRPGEGAEGVRLICPVQISGPICVAIRVMLGTTMVSQYGLDRVLHYSGWSSWR